VDGYWRSKNATGLYPGGTPRQLLDDNEGCQLSQIAQDVKQYLDPESKTLKVIALRPEVFENSFSSKLSAVKREYLCDDGLLNRGRLVHLVLIDNKENDWQKQLDSLACFIAPKKPEHYVNYDAFSWEIRGLLEDLSEFVSKSSEPPEHFFHNQGVRAL